jgi:hypothetical protein
MKKDLRYHFFCGSKNMSVDFSFLSYRFPYLVGTATCVYCCSRLSKKENLLMKFMIKNDADVTALFRQRVGFDHHTVGMSQQSFARCVRFGSTVTHAVALAAIIASTVLLYFKLLGVDETICEKLLRSSKMNGTLISKPAS